MSKPNQHPTPRLGAIAREQLWTAALATRWVWAAAAGFGAFVTFVLADTTGQVSRPEFVPGIVAFPAAMLALLLPLALWRHEAPAQRAYLYSLPVTRLSHQLIKNGALWVWTMIGTAIIHLWGLAVIVPVTNARMGSFAPWQWGAPFVAATVTFLLAAAVVTAFNHPAVMAVAVYFAALFIGSTDVAMTVMTGRYGISTMASGTKLQVTSNLWIVAAPFADWLVATLLWLALGMAALLAASSIRRDV